jgi:hypothetical protein
VVFNKIFYLVERPLVALLLIDCYVIAGNSKVSGNSASFHNFHYFFISWSQFGHSALKRKFKFDILLLKHSSFKTVSFISDVIGSVPAPFTSILMAKSGLEAVASLRPVAGAWLRPQSPQTYNMGGCVAMIFLFINGLQEYCHGVCFECF